MFSSLIRLKEDALLTTGMTGDPYRTLDVSKDASDAEIKRAYRKLARQYHPDRNQGDAAAEERFKSIQSAYERLGPRKEEASTTSRGGWKRCSRGGDRAPRSEEACI